jgi:hypothetical protein
MVCVENRREPDVLRLGFAKNRFPLGGIDDGGLVGLWANNQVPIVVLQKRNLNDFHDVL